MADNVNHPSHYETGKFECIEVMQEAIGTEEVKSFCLCNAFKYLYRAKRKNGLEDVEKAVWYLNKYIELEKKIGTCKINNQENENIDWKDISKIVLNSTLYCENVQKEQKE